jgi:RNA polymerase sigma factor for flagellar operon FliA
MKEIALVLELTESRVCQLHKQAIDLLTKKLAQW